MALTVKEIIIVRRPGTVIDDQVNGLIELAQQMTNVTAFGTRYSHAIALLVCHWLEMGSRMDKAGAISSLSEGQLSISYANAAGDKFEGGLNSTAYGQEYLGLRGLTFAPMVRGQNEIPKVQREYP